MTKSQTDANGQVKQLKGTEINEFVNNNTLAIVDFYATWCPPCKMMDPITEQLAKEFQDEIAFGKINTDKEIVAAQKYQIRFVPTFYLFKNGKVVSQFSGAKKKGDFKELIKKSFKDDN
ncbi:MAG: thioredoxin [Asgard group archaeon]|nr:thioredoxin [Asgard group archaeon]